MNKALSFIATLVILMSQIVNLTNVMCNLTKLLHTLLYPGEARVQTQKYIYCTHFQRYTKIS